MWHNADANLLGKQEMQNSGYRPDIDGLRALAVISVVIFHFNPNWLPGGFIGVDIFFVISGFLITGIVYKEVELGKFSFKKFFMRRVRRILPAALFVTLVTLVFGAIFMLPEDVKDLSESAFASTLSLANVYFWLFLDNGYFATSTDTVPLLHMWSLGVEEQFYLIWPAMLLIIYKLGGPRKLLLSAIILCTAFFILSEHYARTAPEFAYYMLPSRAGELLVGCLTYMLTRGNRKGISSLSSLLLSTSGALLIAWSFIYVDKGSNFPGVVSLAPTVGAALIIASGSLGKSLLGKFLSLSPIVWIGLLSFSLYLWHWPILAFYRYAYGEPTLPGGLICLALIILFTVISYRYIETPFRTGHIKKIKSPVFSTALGVIVIIFSGVTYSRDGYVSDDYAQRVNAMNEMTKAAFSFPYVCQTSKFRESLLSDERCLIGPTDTSPSVLIWGDSNAAHYVGYLKAVAENIGVPMRNVAHSSCVPFFKNSRTFVTKNQDSCEEFNQAIFNNLSNYETVIIGAAWNSYASRDESFEEELRFTIDQLSQRVKSVIIAEKNPIFRGYDRQCPQKAITIPLMNCSERSFARNGGIIPVNNLIESIADEHDNVSLLSIRDLVCNGDICSAYSNNTPLYYDTGHLSLLGSEFLGKMAIDQRLVPTSLTRLENQAP